MDCTITAMLHYAGNPHNATEQHAQIQGAAIFRCPLIATMLFHALCGAQRSSVSLPTAGAERVLDYSRVLRYNSGTRTPRSRYHIIGKAGKTPTNYKGITRNTTFVKFHRTVPLLWVRVRPLQRIKTIVNASFTMVFVGAGDRTRTGTLSPAVDFESTTSTIPSHRQLPH